MSEIKIIKCKHCGCDPIKPERNLYTQTYTTKCRNESCSFHYVNFVGDTEEEAYKTWNMEQDCVTKVSDNNIIYSEYKDAKFLSLKYKKLQEKHNKLLEKFDYCKSECEKYISLYDDLLNEVNVIKDDLLNYKQLSASRIKQIETLEDRYERQLKVTEEYRQEYCKISDENDALYDEIAMMTQEMQEYKDLILKFQEVFGDITKLIERLNKE